MIHTGLLRRSVALLGMCAVFVTAASMATNVHATIVAEWLASPGSPTSNEFATTVAPGLVAGGLLRNGSPLTAGLPGSEINGWFTGYNFSFTLNVPALTYVTLNDWQTRDFGWGDNIRPVTTWSITGDVASGFGSGTFTTGGGINTPHSLSVNPSDVLLPPGNYTILLNLHDPLVTDGAFLKFGGLTLNGTIETVHVPEPSTCGLVGIGLAGLAMVRRRRRS